MVKSRFTSTDVAAMVTSVRPVVLGARVANVYDIAGKLFLIKFSSSLVEDPNEETAPGKATLLIEAGVRFHLTNFERKKSPIPSGWTMNLRKLLKGKQLERMDQAGTDRVVVLQFGIGDKAVYVILELYAKGNVIVTDASFRIQLLLRSHTFDSGEAIAKNEVYPMNQAATVMTLVTPDWASDPAVMEAVNSIDMSGLRTDLTALQDTTSKRKKKLGGVVLREAERVLSKIIPFAHSGLLHAALRAACNEPNGLSVMNRAINHAVALFETAKSVTEDAGYISYASSQVRDFAPTEALLDSHAGEVKKFNSFSSAVDEYFSAIETSGEADRVEAQRKGLLSKVENIKADQQRRIDELILEQELLWEQAELLEASVDVADAAISILNALIAKQMTWTEIAETVAAQGRNGHPIAERIGLIDFDRNRFQLQLSENVRTWIDLGLNATGNVSALHAQRKHQKEKLRKTEQQALAATKAAEAKLRLDLTKFNDTVERDRHLSKVRKRFWFEKFYFFITSEGFLVIAGRDATQNEAIYKKYLKQRDVYVHADIHGAATVVVKNHLPSGDIPPLSLAEAGQFSLCHSSAWMSKVVTSAWWVRADQVSKTAPSGEYLTTGSFMIRGRKNFLPPSRLELGLGVLFYITEDSAKNRAPERTIRGSAGEDEEPTESQPSSVQEDSGIVSIVTTGERLVPKQKQIVKPQPPKKSGSNKKLESVPEKPKEVEEKPATDAKARPKSAASSKKKNQSKKADKYFFDDDAEDEMIRLKLLGIKVEKASSEPTVKAPEIETEKSTAVPTEKACYICGLSDGHLAVDCPQKRRPIVPEPVEAEEEPAETITENYDRLVGSLRDEDELVHALPVCGPYSSISNCSLKVKIVPGSMKRGKAAKLCSQMFGSMESSQAAKKLIKLIPVEEFSECLVNEVKVAGAGVTKLQVENKKAAKLAKKSK